MNENPLIFPTNCLKYKYERRSGKYQGLNLMNGKKLSVAGNVLSLPITSSSISKHFLNGISFANDFTFKKSNHFYLQNLQSSHKHNEVKNDLQLKEVAFIEKDNLRNYKEFSNVEERTLLVDSRALRKSFKPSTIIHQFVKRKSFITKKILLKYTVL